MMTGTVRGEGDSKILVTCVFTPNKIPLTTVVTYLQKSYRSRISNHWATIPACSVVPPIYKQSKKTYCHVSFQQLTGSLQWQPLDSHKMSVAKCTLTPDINKWQLSLCNNSSDNKSYWIHGVNIKVSAQVTTVTYMHQSQPYSHSLCINLTVHLKLWPGSHLIWCNATYNSHVELLSGPVFTVLTVKIILQLQCSTMSVLKS